jgi:hypothetical protein
MSPDNRGRGANARLKDEYGAGNLRVRGHAKAFCHLIYEDRG